MNDMNPMDRVGAVCIILIVFFACIGIFAKIMLYENPNTSTILNNEPDIVLTMMNRTCYGFHNTERDKGIKTTNWFCDDGYIFHDDTGVKLPDDKIYGEDNE